MRALWRSTCDRRCRLPLLLAALVLPACNVTWRQPEIKPLNPVRQFAVDAGSLCDGLLGTLAGLEMEIASVTREENACLVESEFRRLDESKASYEKLDRVAYATNPAFFSHGRYLITGSVREASTGSRLRLTIRIEGFDAGYKLLRSTGVIEEMLFERIGTAVGTAASESGA